MRLKDAFNFRNLTNIVERVRSEKRRQIDKWGEQTHTLEKWLVILAEEFGECNKACLEKDYIGLIAELIQLITVAFNIVDCLLARENSIEYESAQKERSKNG